jgi:hypothetical protein
VRLDRLEYDQWAQGLREGRAYVTDGKGHLLDFRVNGQQVGSGGSEVRLARPGTVRVTAQVAARLAEQPDPALRGLAPDKKPYWDLERARVGAAREVPLELIVNGRAVSRKTIVADGRMGEVAFETAIDRSSWIALRILPSAHTNPMFVLVDGRPVRASKESADWCLRAVDRCWSQKSPRISARERPEAEQAYEHARTVYRRLLAETPE